MSFPFYGKQFTFIQPDGTSLEVKGWGDQHHAVFETLDGFTVIEDPLTGFYQYATLDSDDLRPTGLVPNTVRTTMLSMPKNLRDGREAVKSKVFSALGLTPGKNRWQVRRENKKKELIQHLLQEGPMPAPPQRQTVGSFVGICLLIQFPDVAGTISMQEVDAFCNQSGYNGFGNNGSVKDYFNDNSGGRLLYTNIVAPYYTAKYPRRYYTNESIPQPVRTVELIEEALSFHQQNGFDFSCLTSDSEDYIFAVNVFYAGAVVNRWAKGLWPHAYHLNRPLPLAPGKLAFDYQITNMGHELTLGTFCHENGHMVCDFPDLYDYGYESKGVGAYCLMCAGGSVDSKNPVQVGAYLKYKAGWSDQVTNLAPGMQVQVHAGKNDFYMVRRNAVEYYLLEHRRKAARDAALPGEGLLIWHIDELGDNNNEQGTPTSHYECSMIQADGRLDLERGNNDGDQTDCFGAPHATAFSNKTKPRFKWWDNAPGPLEIHSISGRQNPMHFFTK